jgi:uncharacterized Tic20 family protein
MIIIKKISNFFIESKTKEIVNFEMACFSSSILYRILFTCTSNIIVVIYKFYYYFFNYMTFILSIHPNV